MNDLPMLNKFFQFLLRSMVNSRQNAAKLVIRLPGSDLLKFAYAYLRPSPSVKEQHNLLENLVNILSQLLIVLLELHPFCYDQLDSMGIFDRLEMFSKKISVCYFFLFLNFKKTFF